MLQYYSVDIFASIGFGAERTLLFQSINSVLALFGEAACVMWVDKMGRRKPLIVANIISSMTFCVGTASEPLLLPASLILQPTYFLRITLSVQAKYPASAGNTGASYAFVMMTWIFKFVPLLSSMSLRSSLSVISSVAFSSAIGPLSWAYPVEVSFLMIAAKSKNVLNSLFQIFGTGVRAKATAITSMGCWISNFLIAQVSTVRFQREASR